jgi:hypothetical protein
VACVAKNARVRLGHGCTAQLHPHNAIRDTLHAYTELYSTYVSSRVVKVNLSLCLTNKALRHEGVWRSGCIDPHFLDLGTNWRSMASFTPMPLYRRGKSPQYPSHRWLCGPQSRSELCGENILTLPGL